MLLFQANLQRLVEVRPHLLHLGEKGIRLLSRYMIIINFLVYLIRIYFYLLVS